VKRDPRLVRLSWDHHHGLVLARRISREAPGADGAALAVLYSDVIAAWSAAVLPHFHVEGECLLARLVRYGDATLQVERTVADHLAIQALVADMRDAADLESRRAAMLAFGERLRDHIRWEEADLFERTQALLSDRELDAMAAEIDAALPPYN
jgi:hypothetical protein